MNCWHDLPDQLIGQVQELRKRISPFNRKIIAICLFFIVMASGYYIIPIVIESLTEHNKLYDSRDFDITFEYNFNQQIGYLEGQRPDIEIDLQFHYPYGILTVGQPVNVSGIAILNNTWLPQHVHSLTIYIDNAQKFPVERTAEGFTKGADILLTKTQNNASILVGNNTICWPVEGTYHATLGISEAVNDTYAVYLFGQAPGVGVTVYPKSQAEQMSTDRAVLYLTIAIYLATLVGSLTTALYLWDWKPPKEAL